ncbi:sigma-54-dependent Fis family transcriptional regulator [Effusibacillus dendaii]|uniref:Sigma-54-dependent Fis family transcriptional regulator n=1 Tax=Effusibacillus dendaii TaxID=2743772 RepID=A0A7I8D629_9BACL|nr:sigma-54-dependent Fis family transcriptional regulator [Effusibacillus dendaii]BCJ85608.1 sigma-54-dependent Fis family transcriptional regulator [Effusibacillus dendaii]
MSIIPVSIYKQVNEADVVSIRDKLFEIWRKQLFEEQKDGHLSSKDSIIRDLVLQSWERCKDYRLNPLIQGSTKNLSEHRLIDLQKSNEVLSLAKPIIKKLDHELSNTHHVVLFADQEGVILDAQGDPCTLQKIGNTVNAATGSHWGERWAGTNAIGTSIVLKQPVQLFSSEHYAQGCHQWICSAAPIRDPFSHEVVAVLNLSTENHIIQPRSMMMAIWGANEIERILFQNYYEAREMMQNIYVNSVMKWKNHLVILSDSKGNPLWMNEDFPKEDVRAILSRGLEGNERDREKEWEEGVILVDSRYKARFKKIFWNGRLIGQLALLEEPARMNHHKVKQRNHAKYSFECLIGQSEAFQRTIRLGKVAAQCDSNVLITGESGTGKELIANAIHQASSRCNQPFVAINCAAIPQNLLPSELFGYVGGAYTGANPKGSIGKFEMADHGTIFLDEIGDMPLGLQVHLLRVIQEQEIMRLGGTHCIPINVRVIAATNKNLPEEIKSGRFRQDLYYRINVIEIEMPPLRHRREDIPLLCEHFFKHFAKRKGIGPCVITDEAKQILTQYPWHGNIRQLENVMEYAVNFSSNGQITPEDLPKDLARHDFPLAGGHAENLNPVEQAEMKWILEILERTKMDVTKAAKELNMNRSSIYRKLKKYGYDVAKLKQQFMERGIL